MNTKELVTRFIHEVLAASDESIVDDFLHKDFVRHDKFTVENSSEDVKKNLRRQKEFFTDLKFTIEKMVGENNLVAVYMSSIGKHKETGQELTGKGLVFVEVVDNKISQVWSSWDRPEVAEKAA